jgi:FkbM family methyltransferase
MAKPGSGTLDQLRLDSPIRIVDVGAREEAHPPRYAPLLEIAAGEVIGFEPDSEECERLRATHAQRYHPLVVGAGDRREFRVCEMRSKSSLYEPNHAFASLFNAFDDGSEVVDQQPVETARLDDLPELGEVDFVKLDVQGAELDVLVGGGRTVSSALVVETEVEFVEQYLDQPLFADVDRELRRLGFMFHTVLGYGTRCLKPVVVDGDPLAGLNQWLWADVVFVRHPQRLDELEPRRLIKLAVLMHVLYGSYDLANYALAHADAQSGTDLATEYIHALSDERAVAARAAQGASVTATLR